jgi:hypothetical protein
MFTPPRTQPKDRRTFVYRVDSEDQILYVNSAWCDFAQENGASTLDAESVLHRSLWEFIEDEETRHIFQIILKRVRTDRAVKTVPYRCDAPNLRRFMELQMRSTSNDEVEFRSRVVREEPRESVRLMEDDVVRSDEFLRMCGWCKQVCVETDRWVEVEAAVLELRLFHAAAVPRLTHGICPTCLEAFDYSMS